MNTAAEIENAGGAYVRRAFTVGKRTVKNGDTLTAEQLAAMPIANRRALISAGKLEIYPAGPGGSTGGAAMTGKVENYLVHVGGSQYLVVQGVALTPKPVSRDEAEAIAAGKKQS